MRAWNLKPVRLKKRESHASIFTPIQIPEQPAKTYRSEEAAILANQVAGYTPSLRTR